MKKHSRLLSSGHIPKPDRLSKMPLVVSSKNVDKQALRSGIIAELDAVTLYEQLADASRSRDVKTIMLDVAKEEKTHAGEFLSLLNVKDPEQKAELARGRKEVSKKLGISG